MPRRKSLWNKSDHDRSKFIEAMTGEDWTDLRNCHLSIDTERADFKAAEEMICVLVHEVKGKFRTCKK
jgi:hypothetical protein